MFGKDKKETKERTGSDAATRPRRAEMIRGSGPGAEERRTTAWIGASIVVRGDLTSSEDMTVAGRIEGDVAVPEHTLVVAPGARIRGDITAKTVAVHGEVTGTITGKRLVEVGETASVDGDIVTPRMKVAEGAELSGRMRIAGGGSS